MINPIWIDPDTGLEWSATAPDRMPWQTAMDWCSNLGPGWHLPTIVDDTQYSPAVVEPLTRDTQPDCYWTSTTFVGLPSLAWYVHFLTGASNGYYKTLNF